MRRVGKVSVVAFEEGRLCEEAIIGVGGVVNIRLWFLPSDRRLVLEVIDFIWVIARGKDYGGLRCGGVVSAVLFTERVIVSMKA